MVPLHLLVASLLGWVQREQHEIIRYLREENRVLQAQLRHTRIRLTDEQRRRGATVGAPLGRRRLAQVATIVRGLPDASDGVLGEPRWLICDRDRKWSAGGRSLLEASGVRVIQTPFRAPSAMPTLSDVCGRSRRNAWIF